MKASGRNVPTIIEGRNLEAFVPDPLPLDKPIDLDSETRDLMEDTREAFGGAKSVSNYLPDIDLLVYFYVRKEALLSAQIEGSQSTFPDLLLWESEIESDVPDGDLTEVSGYVAAMRLGLDRMRLDGVTLNLSLIKEMHARLLKEGRGSDKRPGEIRQVQNYIGAKGQPKFVPPPPELVQECLENLEQYINGATEKPLIIAARAHAQFETIHPFLDGNGRLGRLLITLILCKSGGLVDPVLYLSLYFKQNRLDYYEHLDRVRSHGDWIGWIRFFLMGIKETSESVIRTTKAISDQFRDDRDGLASASGEALNLFEKLKKHPVVTAKTAASHLQKSLPTARKIIDELEEVGVLKEITGKKSRRAYRYNAYVNLLSEGVDPITR